MLTNPRIEEEVRAALDHDPRIKHPELIAVSVDEIGTVVLRGAVGTLPERLAATHDARHVEGVFNVIVDDLRLRPPVGPRRPQDPGHAHPRQGFARSPDADGLRQGAGRECCRGRRWREPARSDRGHQPDRTPPGSSKMSAATSRLRGGHGSVWRRHRRAKTAVFALLAAAAFAHYVLPHVMSLGPTLGRLRRGHIAWLALGVALEACSLFGEVALFRGYSPGPVIGSNGAAAPRSPSPVRRPQSSSPRPERKGLR